MVTDATRALVNVALEYARQQLVGGGPPYAFVLTEIRGERNLALQIADTNAESISRAVDAVALLELDPGDCAVLVWDGFVNVPPEGQMDALIAEALDGEGHVVVVAQRYRSGPQGNAGIYGDPVMLGDRPLRLGSSETASADSLANRRRFFASLNLRHAQIPSNGRKLADEIVTAALRLDGIHLDYGVASLRAADSLIEKFRSEGLTVDQIAETLFSIGCYVGEVFVQQGSGTWRLTQETPLASSSGAPMVVQLRPMHYASPLEAVFDRFVGSGPDLTTYFVRSMAG